MKLTAESTVINDDKLNTNIDNAQSTANSAKSVADNTAQYFWFTSSGSDTGAHISEKTQTQFISSPSGGNLLARSNGIAVRDGLTELATFGATSARIGQTGDSHVEIAPTSIIMQTKPTANGSPITTFEVAQTSTTVKTKRTYNISVNSLSYFKDTISLGRTVGSWVSNGIILNYKLNGTSSTKTYSSMPVYDSSGRYSFNAELNGTDVEIQWGVGLGQQAGDIATLVSVELNFTTAQQVVENTIGAYADKTQSGAFRVGNGTATNALSNALLVDWGGNIRSKGDFIANCDSTSNGGISLAKVDASAYAFIYESGSNQVTIDKYVIGKVVMLVIAFTKSSSTASGSNLFDINLAGANIPEPAIGTIGNESGLGITGSTYYGAHSIGFLIEPDPNVPYITDPMSYYHLVIRNASNSGVTASGGGVGTLMYICR